MNTFTLELITDLPAELEWELPLVVHVHRRLENFQFLRQVKDHCVPLDYIENEELNAQNVLEISDYTNHILANSKKEITEGYESRNGTTITSAYRNLMITDEYFINQRGFKEPLWYVHELPAGAKDIQVETYINGNKVNQSLKYKVKGSSIYTDFLNEYDLVSGSTKLHWVLFSLGGVGKKVLLNARAAARPVEWYDIDTTTGDIKVDHLLYTLTESTSGFTYTVNRPGLLFYKPGIDSQISFQKVSGFNNKEPWYMEFKAGSFKTIVNSSLRKYEIKEYFTQPFFPSAPYLPKYNQVALKVSNQVIWINDRKVSIEPLSNRHLEIFIRNAEDNLIHALTTDVLKTNKRINGVVYNTVDIVSWDEEEGFVHLNLGLEDSWTIEVNYFSKAQNYVNTDINLNIYHRPDLENKMVVFYLVPDVSSGEKSLFYLIVNEDGFIVEANQFQQSTTPEFRLEDDLGNYNSFTVIGTKYSNWLDTFAVNRLNSFAYFVLSEITFLNPSFKEDQIVVDVRREGNTIVPSKLESVVYQKPTILQSSLFYGPDGQEVPRNNVFVIEVPLSLLEEYGGNLTQQEAESLLRQDIPISVYTVFKWTAPQSEFTVTSLSSGEVTIDWEWIGQGLTYRVYEKENPTGEWVLIHTLTNPALGPLSFTQTGLTSGDVMYYCVRVVKDGQEYLEKYSYAIEVS